MVLLKTDPGKYHKALQLMLGWKLNLKTSKKKPNSNIPAINMQLIYEAKDGRVIEDPKLTKLQIHKEWKERLGGINAEEPGNSNNGLSSERLASIANSI